MMEGLCAVLRLLPADRAATYRVDFLGHQLEQARLALQQAQTQGAAERVVAALQLMTVIVRYSSSRSGTAASGLCAYFQGGWGFFEELVRVLGSEE